MGLVCPCEIVKVVKDQGRQDGRVLAIFSGRIGLGLGWLWKGSKSIIRWLGLVMGKESTHLSTTHDAISKFYSPTKSIIKATQRSYGITYFRNFPNIFSYERGTANITPNYQANSKSNTASYTTSYDSSNQTNVSANTFPDINIASYTISH